MQSLRVVDPARYATLIEELTYLGNVLLAAAGPKVGLEAYDALLAGLGVCDLGLARWPEPTDASALLRTTTADRLFRHGLATLAEHDFTGRHAAALAPFRTWLL